MSVVGGRVGVISLGMSCQSALQIRDNVEVLKRVCGDDALAASGLPFDSIVCPPESAIKMLRTDTFFPPSPADVVLYRGGHWRDYNVYFRHEFTLRKKHFLEYLTKRVNVRRAHRELASKFGYMADKFRKLGRFERLVFVMSNTQNDLAEYKDELGMDYVVAMDAIERLCDQCDAYFGRPCEYMFVTYEDRVTGRATRERLKVFKVSPDATPWQGDWDQWKAIFENYFTATEPVAAK